MFELLKNLLSGHNQFATGGLLLMVIGGLGVYLRALPERLWDWFVSQTTLMITVKDDDAAFVWVKEWFMEQDFLARVRRVDLDTTLRGEGLKLIPAPGRHWFWHGRRPFVVYFHRSENVEARSQRRTESFTFNTIGRHQDFLRQFVAEVVKSHEKVLRLRSPLFVYDDYWTRLLSYSPRLLDSVILKPGEKERLIQDIERFKASKKRYTELGVPYHRGYLFYGPPGTGKTSLASALAQKFGMSVYAVNLNDFNDRTLATAIREVPPDSVILFEDIDCMTSGKTREIAVDGLAKNSANSGNNGTVADVVGVTLSGLLNVLDGFSAPDSVLFVMTTNRVEALDPALLRPGRIDYKLYMGDASTRQKVDLYRRFFPSASELEALAFVDEHPSATSMAEFQGLLLRLERHDVATSENDEEPSSSGEAEKLFLR
ncbi:MAG TPA: AAA family ATPase [Terriglobia bacterium]|nr:AAA family ATPase [Terriglobia bacterium]